MRKAPTAPPPTGIGGAPIPPLPDATDPAQLAREGAGYGGSAAALLKAEKDKPDE